ncbi:hypothetical protein V6N13_022950 [Hibiscus sabdariffa]
MLVATVVRPCLVALVVVVLAQQPTGWCIPVVSLCSVPGVARHDACSLPSLRAIRGPGWCTACMCPRIFAWPLVGPWFRVLLYASNDALFFMAASSCRGRSGKIRVPFPDARHALALSLHYLVAGNGARHPAYNGGPCLVRQGPTASAALMVGTWCSVAPTHPSSAGRTVDLPRPLRTAVSALPAMVFSHGAGLWVPAPSRYCPVGLAHDNWPVRPLLAWRASHPWAGFFGPLSCAARLCLLAFVSFLSPSRRLLGRRLLSYFASLLSQLCLLLLHATHG